jgi:hypothetical protein
MIWKRATTVALLLVALAATGCTPDPVKSDAGDDAAGDSGDTDTDSDTDSDTDPDAGDDAGDDAGPDGGDAGEGGTDTDSGDGTCEPAGSLAADTPILGSTEGEANDLDDYSCSDIDESGPDVAHVYVNEADAPMRVTALLTELEADLDLFLLLGSCDIDSCVAHSAGQGDETADAVVETGEPLFVAIDGYEGAEGTFELAIQVEPVELDCDDDIDDDDDGLTDCADEDCLLAPVCVQTCMAEGPIGCGEAISGTTEGADSTIHVYATYAADFTGPERIFAFGGATAGTAVEVRLVGAPPDLELLVLGEVCASDAAVLTGPTQALFAPIAAVTYYVVVDGRNGAFGAFDLTLDCLEAACNDDSDNDDDGLTDCADPDCEVDEACVIPCSPLSPDGGCPDDAGAPDGGLDSGLPALACYPLAPDPYAGFCHSPSDAGAGTPCEMPYDCAPGLTCTPADICLVYCDLDDSIPGCDAGDCTSIGSDPLGVCWD